MYFMETSENNMEDLGVPPYFRKPSCHHISSISIFDGSRCYLSMWVQDIFIALQIFVIVCSRMLEMIG